MKEEQKIINKIIKIAKEKKGFNIKKYSNKRLTYFANYIIIIECFNMQHCRALCDEILLKLKEENYKVENIDGTYQTEWVILDYGNIFVNILTSKKREYYQLDELFQKIK
ncbi:MAG TPA: ribosome silencing factor [bacterium]|nr:ribosome silencing factor [bacterium]HOL47001.1 ribosome silencing factor [bacterium]HPQ19003.1 ribosome silencing factor [bacterium]